MANRIAGNILIVDSAMGNSTVIVGMQNNNWRINAVAFWGADSSGALLLTGANTAQDIIFKHDFPTGAQNNIMNPKWFSFSEPQSIGDLKSPVVTAGTAFIYLA